MEDLYKDKKDEKSIIKVDYAMGLKSSSKEEIEEDFALLPDVKECKYSAPTFKDYKDITEDDCKFLKNRGTLLIKMPEIKVNYNMGLKSLDKKEIEEDCKYTIPILLNFEEDKEAAKLMEMMRSFDKLSDDFKKGDRRIKMPFKLPKCYKGYLDREGELKVKVNIESDSISIDEYINKLMEEFKVMKSGIRYVNHIKIVRKVKEDYLSVEDYLEAVKNTFTTAQEKENIIFNDDSNVYWEVKDKFLYKNN